jgi:hypothetical protein
MLQATTISSTKSIIMGFRDPQGHGGTFSRPNGGDWAKIAVNRLDWQLKGDAEAGAWFVGEDCGYRTDAEWTVEYHP